MYTCRIVRTVCGPNCKDIFVKARTSFAPEGRWYWSKGKNCNINIQFGGTAALSNLTLNKTKNIRIRVDNLSLCDRFFGSTPVKLSKTLSSNDLKKAIEQLTDQFMEARELLDDARESMGKVYFTEDMQDAQAAVKETLSQYQDLLATLTEEQKQEVLRTIGLKMEELKAQEDAIKEALTEDH